MTESWVCTDVKPVVKLNYNWAIYEGAARSEENYS